MKYLEFTKSSVLVIGDLMLDKYHLGRVDRISPEAPVPVVNVRETRITLGGAGNVVNNICTLGGRACIIAIIGNCANGQQAKLMLNERNVQYRLLTRQNQTITKVRIIGEHQQIVRVDFEDIVWLSPKELNTAKSYLKYFENQVNCVVISDYGKGMISNQFCRHTIEWARRHSLPVLVDPKGNNWEKYRGATMITPNVKELSGVVASELPNEDAVIESWGKRVREEFDLDYLLVTRSEKGMSLISAHGPYHIRSAAREVYDVSGAGDTVIATVAAGLSVGMTVMNAVQAANRAAGIVVGKLGTAPIYIEELNRHIINQDHQADNS